MICKYFQNNKILNSYI